MVNVAGEPETLSAVFCACAAFVHPAIGRRRAHRATAERLMEFTGLIRLIAMDQTPPVIVYVTTRVAEVMTPAAGVASSL